MVSFLKLHPSCQPQPSSSFSVLKIPAVLTFKLQQKTEQCASGWADGHV